MLARGRVWRNGKNNTSCKCPLLEAAAVLAPPLENGVGVGCGISFVECRRTGSCDQVLRQLRLQSWDEAEGKKRLDSREIVHRCWNGVCGGEVWVEDTYDATELVNIDQAVVGLARTRRFLPLADFRGNFRNSHFSLARRFPAEFPETYVRGN